ncbi:hypothetical protein [Nocardioides sp. 503]|uniref:hypothetical protein n=1 Tax=Nocardioides sp. 503 TaxID=2508326 RepID=UPI0010704D6E|nr:hypothetical protein [Nocardioides sp. 503]
MSDYDVYETPDDGGAETPAAPEAEEQWRVLVEYANSGQSKPPTVVDVRGPVYVSRAVALEAAQRQAFDYQPPDPLSPRGRTVYQRPDGFLTIVEGAMTTFHFRTHVVRLLGTSDH